MDLSKVDIYIIGDSHAAGQFGSSLVHELLRDGANSVTLDAKSGRSVISYLKQEHPLPGLRKHLRSNDATNDDLVIVALGTNDAVRNLAATERALTTLSHEIHMESANMICVGPPLFTSKELNAKAAKVIELERATCDEFIDSRQLVTADAGIHVKAKTAVGWASAVETQIAGYSSFELWTILLIALINSR